MSIPCLQVSLGEFELKAPITIRLKAGTGPVTVSGLHLIGNHLSPALITLTYALAHTHPFGRTHHRVEVGKCEYDLYSKYANLVVA